MHLRNIILSFFLCQGLILFAQYPTQITVSPDGSGDYTSIQEAINDTKAFPDLPITIYIQPGVYEERVRIYPWNTNLTLEGADPSTTIIRYDDHFKRTDLGRNSTFHTWTLAVEADDVTLKNVSIENSAGPVGQALALYISGDRCVVRNCTLKGYQDTLYCTGEQSRQYFYNCRIEGSTDFIFGNATALFESCTLHSLADSYITAASTTSRQDHGFVFKDCQLTANAGVERVYLGRPWRKNAATVFINCEYGSHIRPEGWQIWSNDADPRSARYAEYTLSDTRERAAWSRQLKKKDLKHYQTEKIFRGWKPR